MQEITAGPEAQALNERLSEALKAALTLKAGSNRFHKRRQHETKLAAMTPAQRRKKTKRYERRAAARKVSQQKARAGLLPKLERANLHPRHKRGG